MVDHGKKRKTGELQVKKMAEENQHNPFHVLDDDKDTKAEDTKAEDTKGHQS